MKKIKSVLHHLFIGGCIVSGIDTLLIIGCGAYAGTASLLSGTAWATPIAFLVAAASGLFGAYALDVALSRLLPDTFKGLAAGHHRTHWKLYSYLLAVCLIMGGGSIAVTLYCRAFVAHTVVGAPTLASIEEKTAIAASAATANVMAIDKDIASLARQRNIAVRSAASPQLEKLATAGNPWAQNEVARAKSRVADKFNTLIQGKMADKSTLLASSSSLQQRIADDVSTANKMAIEKNVTSRAAIGTLQTFSAVGGTLLMFIAAIGMALLYSAYSLGEDPFVGMAKKTITTSQSFVTEKNKTVTNAPISTPSAPRSATLVTPEPAVITADESVKPVTEFDGITVFENDGKITAIKKNGQSMDATKLKQYISVYSSRAENSKGEATRNLNRDKASLFQKALQDIL